MKLDVYVSVIRRSAEKLVRVLTCGVDPSSERAKNMPSPFICDGPPWRAIAAGLMPASSDYLSRKYRPGRHELQLFVVIARISPAYCNFGPMRAADPPLRPV
jgi:hypothetical protein